MKRIMLCSISLCFICCISAYSQSFLSVGGGISLPTRNYNESYYPGFNASLVVLGIPVKKHLAIGGDISYTRWTAKLPRTLPAIVKESLSCSRLIAIIRGCTSFNSFSSAFLEFGDGICMQNDRITFGDSFESTIKIGNGIIFGVGFSVNVFTLVLRYNMSWFDGTPLNWTSINIGFGGYQRH